MMFGPPNMEVFIPKEPKPEQCPIGFLVHPGRLVDPVRGCGHTRCYPPSCEFLKRLGL